MRKKDLIQGEVYKHYNGNLIKFQEYSSKTTIIGEYLGDSCSFYVSYYDSSFTISNLSVTSPEEKHWLEECIKLNKFISKKEALKTFIKKSKFISETEVESANDGYFKVGDKVSIINSKNPVFRNKKYFTIKSFRWNNPKTEICAILNNNFPNGIGIDKLQIYVEPKLKNEFISLKQAVKIKNNNFNNETLLEKAKRLYPIGTKIKSTIGTIGIIQTNNYRNDLKSEDYYYADNGKLELYNFRLNIWAEIIEYPHGFKIGNLIQLLKSEQKLQHVITKIEGNELFYNFNNKEFKILAKNAVKVK